MVNNEGTEGMCTHMSEMRDLQSEISATVVFTNVPISPKSSVHI